MLVGVGVGVEWSEGNRVMYKKGQTTTATVARAVATQNVIISYPGVLRPGLKFGLLDTRKKSIIFLKEMS